MPRLLLSTLKEASIRGSLTAQSPLPPLHKTRVSEQVSLLTAKVSVLKLPHPLLSILWSMCPQLTCKLLPKLSHELQLHCPDRCKVAN